MPSPCPQVIDAPLQEEIVLALPRAAILDHLDMLTLLQVRMVFDLFARLASDASDAPDASRSLDELSSIISKHLTNANVKYKRLGLLGGCCLLSRIGAWRDGSGAECAETERAESSCAGEEAGEARSMDVRRIVRVRELIEEMFENSTEADGSRECALPLPSQQRLLSTPPHSLIDPELPNTRPYKILTRTLSGHSHSSPYPGAGSCSASCPAWWRRATCAR